MYFVWRLTRLAIESFERKKLSGWVYYLFNQKVWLPFGGIQVSVYNRTHAITFQRYFKYARAYIK